MVTSETPIKSKVRCYNIQPPMHTHIHLIARHRQREEACNIPHPLKCEEPYSKLSVLRVGVTEYRRLATISSVHESRRQCSQYKTYIVLLKCNKTTIPQRLITRRREQIVLHTIQQNESETNTSLLGTAHNIIIPIRLLKATTWTRQPYTINNYTQKHSYIHFHTQSHCHPRNHP